MTDSLSSRPSKYPAETLEPRSVTRLIHRPLHEEGNDVANFLGDLQDLLIDGEVCGLTANELSMLTYFSRYAVRPHPIDGKPVVLLSGRQWSKFVGIRRRFLATQRQHRDPLKFIADLRAQRQSSAASNTFENR